MPRIKIELEMEDEQLDLIINSMESVFRLGMKQTYDMAEFLASDTYKYDKNNPNNEKLFEAYLTRRDALENVLRAAVNIAYGEYPNKVSDTVENIVDVWEVLRHERYMHIQERDGDDGNDWDTRRRTPFIRGTIRRPMKCKIEDVN